MIYDPTHPIEGRETTADLDTDSVLQSCLSPAHRALADLCGAIAAEVDLDACGVRLGKAMEAARVALDFHTRAADRA